MGDVQAGDGGIAVGGSVINSLLITGNVSGDVQAFFGDYERLRDAYLRPDSVFERVRLERFAGRHWLTTRVDAFFESNDRGCLILEAGAGLGKTTFLARLVRERGYLHHFVELAPGSGGVAVALKSLAAQIILAWRVAPYAGEEVLPLSADRPDFLQGLLFEAARRRDETAPGERIVLAVDALDESSAPPGQNVLGLPRVLPPGVFLLVTHRPVPVTLNVEAPREVIRIEAAEPENLADMRAYLDAACRLETVARRLRDGGMTGERFTQALMDKCQGVWIYLHYVIGEIEQGERPVGDLDSLPDGIWQYYAQYWARWQERPDWRDLGLPLAATLAAAQEDLPLERLCALAGGVDAAAARSLLQQGWRPFLVLLDRPERRYRLYHASLREFLDGRADAEALTAAQLSLSEELAAAVRAAHSRFADRTLTAWGGLDQGLPGLDTPGGRDLDDGYDFRHLVTHLVGAGRLPDLFRLLTLEWTRERSGFAERSGWRGLLDRLRGIRSRESRRGEPVNAWHTAREESGAPALYLEDVERVWRAAEASSERDIQAGEPARAVSLEILCALLTASVGSLAGSIGPRLLAAALEKGITQADFALAYALRVPDPFERGVSLIHLARHLEEPAQRKALYPVLDSLRYSAPGRHDRKERLVEAFPPGLPEAFLRQVVEAARGLSDEWEKAGVLEALASKIPPALLPDVRQAAEPLREEERVKVLAALVEAFPPPVPSDLVAETRGLAQGLNTEPTRSQALLRVADHLPGEERARVLGLARDTILAGKWGRHQRAELLILLLSKWRGPGREAIAEEALASVLAVGNGADRLFPRLVPLLSEQARNRAVSAVLEAEDRWSQMHLTTGLAVDAARSGRPREALEHVREIDPSFSDNRARALAEVAPHLPPDLQPEALALARELWSGARRIALDGLAPSLPEPLLRRAFAASREISDATDLLRGRLGLAPELARHGRGRDMLGWAVDLYWQGGEAVERLAPSLPSADLGEAVDRARTMKDPADRAQALTGLALALPAEQRRPVLARALAAARKSRRPGEEPNNLLRLLPHLEGRARQKVLRRLPRLLRRLALDRRDSWWFVGALGSVVPELPEETLRDILGLAACLVGTGHQQTAIQLLAPRVPEILMREILLEPERAWHSEPRPVERRQEGRKSDPGLLESWISRVLPRPALRARALAEQACGLPPGGKREVLLRQSLSASRDIESPADRAEVVALLAQLTEDREVLQCGLASCLAIQDPARRADALEAYVPLLEPAHRQRVLLACRALRGEVGEPALEEALRELTEAGSPETLLTVVRGLDGTEKERVMAEALEAVTGSGSGDATFWAALSLVPHLSREQTEAVLLENLSLAGGFMRLRRYTEAVRSRGRELSEPFWREVLKRLETETPWVRAQLLPDILPLLPLPLVPEVPPLIPGGPEGERLLDVLPALAARLTELPLADLYTFWRTLLHRLAGGTRGGLAEDLGALAPVMARLGGREALETAFEAFDQVGLWWR